MFLRHNDNDSSNKNKGWFKTFTNYITGSDPKSTSIFSVIEGTFYAYFDMLKKLQGSLWGEETSTIIDRILQWTCLMQSYTRAKCKDRMINQDLPKIDRHIVIVSVLNLHLELNFHRS